MGQIAVIDRTVSGKGTITLPSSYSKANRIRLKVDVIRENRSVYRNYAKNPSESFFGWIVACGEDDYVLAKYQVEFDKQEFILWDAAVNNVLLAVKCLEVSNNVHFGQIPNIELFQFLPEFGYYKCPLKTLKFKCFGGTALRLYMSGMNLDMCGDNDPPEPRDEPAPPPPVDKVPPDEPVEVSEPEPEAPEDTEPYPGDEFPSDFPIGEPCQPIVLSWQFYGNNPVSGEQQSIVVLGTVYNAVLVPNPDTPVPGYPDFVRDCDLVITSSPPEACDSDEVVTYTQASYGVVDPGSLTAAIQLD